MLKWHKNGIGKIKFSMQTVTDTSLGNTLIPFHLHLACGADQIAMRINKQFITQNNVFVCHL